MWLNHSDSTLVMRLPKEKIIFVVDLFPVGQVPGRGMIDFYPIEAQASLQKTIAMHWERLILVTPASAAGSAARRTPRTCSRSSRTPGVRCKRPREGTCWDGAEKKPKLPKYAAWGGYENNLACVLRRYCGPWGQGSRGPLQGIPDLAAAARV